MIHSIGKSLFLKTARNACFLTILISVLSLDAQPALPQQFCWADADGQEPWDLSWSYKPEEVEGPETWGTKSSALGHTEKWSLCQLGRHQSPVDIQTDRLVYDHSLKPIEISGSDEQLELIVENVGQDLRLSLLSEQIILSGGPFSYQFQAVSLNIKFGSISSRGSDHRIDGRSLPGELQIYAFNRNLYKNFSHALVQPHGIVAVSVFFKLCNISNKDILGIVAAAEKTVFKGQKFQLRGLELRSLLSSTREYMTYDGSLPFPGCHETVKWIILNHPVSISETELKTLRRLRIADTLWSGSMADNFRPVQPINHRTVSTNINFNNVDEVCNMKKQISYIANLPRDV